MVIDPGQRKYGWNSNAPSRAHNYIYPAVQNLLPNKGNLSILDAGCGNGFISGNLVDAGHQVCAFDLSEDGIAIARKTYPNVHFEVYSVYDDLTAITSQVDLVISTEVIEHLYYPRKFLENIQQVIKPGGHLIITTPYHGYIKNLVLSIMNKWDRHFTVDREGGHIKFFSPNTLKLMLTTCGFTNLKFNNAGRVPCLWKSMACRAQKEQ
jgi:2-polyprenyl-3-methyl-5-hydroxy-6-metoxy-1,4-benzoquinol methylase